MTTPNAAAALLSCPFCGHGESLYVEHVDGTIVHPAYFVRCDYCGAVGPFTDKGNHAEIWNTRASLAQKGEAVAWMWEHPMLRKFVTLVDERGDYSGTAWKVTPLFTHPAAVDEAARKLCDTIDNECESVTSDKVWEAKEALTVALLPAASDGEKV